MSSNLQAALIPFFAYAWYFLLVKPIHLLVMACLKWRTPSYQRIRNKRQSLSASPLPRSEGHNSGSTYQAQGKDIYPQQKTLKKVRTKKQKLSISSFIPKGGDSGL